MSEPRIISNQQFYGGQASDAAIGTAASFSYSRALDHRLNPSQLTVLPGPRKIGVPNDLILNIIQTNSGVRYGYGDQGYVYKIDTSNVLTHVNKLATGSDGALYRSDTDACFFATQTTIQRYFPMSGSPTFDVTYGPTKSIDSAAYLTGGTSTYTVPLVLDEAQAQYFQPDIEPFYSMKVNVIAKGTGDVTLKLHDGLNTLLASVTVTAANMKTGLVEFVFSSQVRALVKPNARTYHFHLTSTVADTTIASSTSGSLDTADYELWAYLLVDTVNGFHPMIQFQQFTCIGNGNYLAVWEPLTANNPPNSELQRHRLTLPTGFEICGLALTDEFLVIAAGKQATAGTKDFQEGKLFIWDGIAQTYNQVIDVAGGSPEGIQSDQNYPYFTVNGTLCAWAGGKNIIKVRTFANSNTAYTDVVDNTHVYPNMLCVKDGLLHAGYPSITTNVNIEHGVYVWGSLEKNYPASFNYGYVASHGVNLNTSGNLQLGCLRNFGDEMYMSWKDANGNFGLDIVDSLCDPAPVFKFRARRFDAGAGYVDKQAQRMSIDSAALPVGVIITPTYKIDNAAEQVLTEFAMVATNAHKVATIPQGRGTFKRITYGFDGASTATSTPIIYANSLQWDALADRKAL